MSSINRRGFLRLSLLNLGGLALSACAPATTIPTSAPTEPPVPTQTPPPASEPSPAATAASASTAEGGGADPAEAPTSTSAPPPAAGLDGTMPAEPVRLIFIHHSTGENWLADNNGQLGIALRDNNYFVSDTNYGWGPDRIGDRTDLGNWYDWFLSPNRDRYMEALVNESKQNSSYSRLRKNPGGPNQIVMFKSCFPNSNISGSPEDAPATGENPLYGLDSSNYQAMSVANIKGLYNELLGYFSTQPDILFVAVCAPPLHKDSTSPENAANAREVNNWLQGEWLASNNYTQKNVAVFDFFNVLTSSAGSPDQNDLEQAQGNHHRLKGNTEEHLQTVDSNLLAYPTNGNDSHPSQAGNLKASAEYLPLLNGFYNRWKAG